MKDSIAILQEAYENMLDQNIEVGDRVNFRNNRGNGNWLVTDVDDNSVTIMYGWPEKPTKVPKNYNIYVTQKKKI